MSDKKKKNLPVRPDVDRIKVKKGDTLSKIGKKIHVSVPTLRKLNPKGIDKGDIIHPGQFLKYPSIKKGIHPRVNTEMRHMGHDWAGDTEYKGKDPRTRTYKSRTSGGIKRIPKEPDVKRHTHSSGGRVKGRPRGIGKALRGGGAVTRS